LKNVVAEMTEMLATARFIKEIGRGKDGARSLVREDARLLYQAMLDGRVSDLELGAILLAMRVKGESVEEIAGFLDAAEDSLQKLQAPAAAFAPVVIPSYNGSRHMANLTPLLALLLAREGVPVLMHGVTHDPQRITSAEIFAELGLPAAADVAQAVRQNNYQAAPGKLKGMFVVSNIRVNTDLTSIEEFRDLVLRNDGNGLVRVKDIGTVELAAAATETSAQMNGKPAVHVGLFPTPAGNPLVIVDGIRTLLPAVRQTLPPGVHVELAFETARFIQASINEVSHTLIEALLIVVLVIYLCLGSLRTVLIPVVTIPLSMLGAAGLMLMLIGLAWLLKA